MNRTESIKIEEIIIFYEEFYSQISKLINILWNYYGIIIYNVEYNKIKCQCRIERILSELKRRELYSLLSYSTFNNVYYSIKNRIKYSKWLIELNILKQILYLSIPISYEGFYSQINK